MQSIVTETLIAFGLALLAEAGFVAAERLRAYRSRRRPGGQASHAGAVGAAAR